jgi:predicted N-acetyltransferase YhbS
LIEYRTLKRDEIERIWEIDRSELITQLYRMRDGQLEIEAVSYDLRGWRPGTVEHGTPLLYDCFDRGGQIFAAFEGDRIVGAAVVGANRYGPNHDLMNLVKLYVSQDYRKRGIGATLFEQALNAVRKAGAKGLYISATPTVSAVEFYQRQGAVLNPLPDPELFALEPEDIHLICWV